jgi:hypothetical protein
VDAEGEGAGGGVGAAERAGAGPVRLLGGHHRHARHLCEHSPTQTNATLSIRMASDTGFRV